MGGVNEPDETRKKDRKFHKILQEIRDGLKKRLKDDTTSPRERKKLIR